MNRNDERGAGPVLELRGVTRFFGKTRALERVDLALAPGQIVGLIGRNGSGKTTLLRHVVGLMLPDEGTVRTLGTPSAKDGIYASMKEMSIMGPASPRLIQTATPVITDAEIATYIADEPFATWGGTTDEKLEKIWTQKWLAMCFMQNEPWAEMRRTDTPNWGIARNSYYDGHNRDPFRLPYPADEELMNSENSATYFERMYEGDYLWGEQLWWDKRTGVQ